jgi:hypothetical protein
MRSVSGILTMLLALLPACGTGPQGVQQIQALVGFTTAVDTSVLRRAGATDQRDEAEPPVAQVIGTEAAFAQLGSQPAIVFVNRTGDTSDSAAACIIFADRLGTSDSLTSADITLLRRVGGRLIWIYQASGWAVVYVPVAALSVLQTDSLIGRFIAMVGGGGSPI